MFRLNPFWLSFPCVRLALFLPVLWLPVLAGCGDGLTMAPVAGTVTLNGKPLADAAVTFTPISENPEQPIGLSSHGQTDDQGRFTLETIDGRKGAVVGQHKVYVSTVQSTVDENGKVKQTKPELVPKKYVDAPPVVEVPASGSDTLAVELTSGR